MSSTTSQIVDHQINLGKVIYKEKLAHINYVVYLILTKRLIVTNALTNIPIIIHLYTYAAPTCTQNLLGHKRMLMANTSTFW